MCLTHYAKRSSYWLILLTIGTSSCTLYQPLLATHPAVRKQGDVAVAANWQFPYGVQSAVIVSPVPHVLAFAAGGLQAYKTKQDSSDYARNRQYEAGLGGYSTVGRVWLGGLVGAGQGRGFRYGRFQSSNFFNPGVLVVPGGVSGSSGAHIPIPELLGYYNTRFGQVTAWWTDAHRPALEWGSSLRLTQVRFTSLTLNNAVLPLTSQHYLQASLLAQQLVSRRLKWQASASWDVALNNISNDHAFARAPLRVMVGLAFCPQKAPGR